MKESEQERFVKISITLTFIIANCFHPAECLLLVVVFMRTILIILDFYWGRIGPILLRPNWGYSRDEQKLFLPRLNSWRIRFKTFHLRLFWNTSIRKYIPLLKLWLLAKGLDLSLTCGTLKKWNSKRNTLNQLEQSCIGIWGFPFCTMTRLCSIKSNLIELKVSSPRSATRSSPPSHKRMYR